MATRLGDTIRFQFSFNDAATGAVILTSGTPTATVTKPDGTQATGNCTRLGSTNYWYRDAVTDALGTWLAQGFTADAAAFPETGVAVEQVVAQAAQPTVGEIADGVWDEAISGHLTAGTTGNKLNAASSAGDPWSTELPGEYGDGTAGEILGTLLGDLSASGVTVTSPLADDGTTITVVQGDTYDTDETRAASWDLSDPGYDLSGASAAFATASGFTKALTITGDVLTLELTAAETAAFGVGSVRYQARVTLANGHRLTVAEGSFNVLRQYAAG